jgi:hypothetical protein
MKRLPINLRFLFMVPKEQNPKGMALFVSALLNLKKINFLDDDETILNLVDRLVQLRSPDKPYYCWGYNFNWQNRYFSLPKYHPNIIGTTFAGNALIDAYESFGKKKYLEMAQSGGRFILEGLNISPVGDDICFSYTPYDHAKVHNANMLGAAYLARIFYITGEKEFLDYAIKAMHYSVKKQNEDGSWYYGEGEKQRWIDNFHTGYNLIALINYYRYTKSEEFENNIQRGYNFYLDHFFTSEGIAKYYHDKIYPIDIHSIAQSIITLTELHNYDNRSLQLAEVVFEWSIKYMRHTKGYFYYQRGSFFTNRISYIRWSQAWMLYAMSIFAGKTYSTEILV